MGFSTREVINLIILEYFPKYEILNVRIKDGFWDVLLHSIRKKEAFSHECLKRYQKRYYLKKPLFYFDEKVRLLTS